MLIEEPLGLIAPHPLFDDAQVLGIRSHIEYRHLMSSPEILYLVPIDLLRSGPSFGRSKNNHGPACPVGLASAARLLLNRADLQYASFDSRSHFLMHQLRIVTLDHIWSPSISFKKVLEFIRADAGQQCGVRDLVSVQMKNGQNRAITNGIQKLVRVPRSRQGPRFRFPISDDDAHDQIRVVESRSERMRHAVA